jgi:hypothetical protein
VGQFIVLYFIGNLLEVLENKVLGLKVLSGMNTLAYFDFVCDKVKKITMTFSCYSDKNSDISCKYSAYFVVMLSVVKLSVVMRSIIMQSVVFLLLCLVPLYKKLLC